MQGLIFELEQQRNWALTRAAQMYQKIVELEAELEKCRAALDTNEITSKSISPKHESAANSEL